MEYNGEDIRKAQMEQRQRILKSFGETNLFSGEGDSNKLMRSMEKAEENDIEKAKHQDGDMHPNGRWVWRQSANGGKGDWRVANPKRGGGSRAAASAAKTTSSEGDSGKTTGEPNEKSWGKIKEFATKTKKVFVARDNGVDCPAIRITGDKTYAQKVIKEMNEYCGTNYSISDFERYPKTRYSDNSYEAYVNIHNGKLYSSDKEAEKVDLNNAKLRYQSDGTPFALSNAVIGLTKNEFDKLKKKYSSLSSMKYDGGTEQEEAVFNAIVRNSESYKDVVKNLNNSNITFDNWKLDSVNEDYAVLSTKKNNDVYKLVISPKTQKPSASDSKKTDSKKIGKTDADEVKSMVKWIQGKNGTNWTYDDANKAMEFLQKVPAKYRSNDRNIINKMRKTLYNLQVELSK